jgi:hypothetical protein
MPRTSGLACSAIAFWAARMFCFLAPEGLARLAMLSPEGDRPRLEIDRFGEHLVGCIACNRWTWPHSENVSMALPEEDRYAIRATLTRC